MTCSSTRKLREQDGILDFIALTCSKHKAFFNLSIKSTRLLSVEFMQLSDLVENINLGTGTT